MAAAHAQGHGELREPIFFVPRVVWGASERDGERARPGVRLGWVKATHILGEAGCSWAELNEVAEWRWARPVRR